MTEPRNQHEDQPAGAAKARANRTVARRLAYVAIGMFGFGFAMWPMYNLICDITGLGGRSVKTAATGSAVETSQREVRIRFLATANSSLDWEFQPGEKTKTVKLGDMSETLYIAMNPTDKDMVGHATFNIVPAEASLYFVKTECFCFREQLLLAQETRELPVYFFVQPDLPEDIREITLAYTFYPSQQGKDPANAVAALQP